MDEEYYDDVKNDNESLSVHELIKNSDRWAVITLNSNGVNVVVSDDNINKPHIADMISVGLIQSGLFYFNESLYDNIKTKENMNGVLREKSTT